MTYNVFSGTLNPTHFTSPPLAETQTDQRGSKYYPANRLAAVEVILLFDTTLLEVRLASVTVGAFIDMLPTVH